MTTQNLLSNNPINNPINNEFIVPHYSMISGQGLVEENKFYLYVGKSGLRWLVADQPGCASYVYVEGRYSANELSHYRGFGGATLKFKLVDGDSIELTGPWHSNADALFADTGVDIRDQYLTFVVIGLGQRNTDDGRYVITGVIYNDGRPKLGVYDRVPEILANINKKYKLKGDKGYFYRASLTGSSYGPCDLKKVNNV